MSRSSSFLNNYEDYSIGAGNQILNYSENAVSENFQEKLLNFRKTKLNHLTTQMKDDIFHDGTVYTGSSGLALYYYTFSLGKDNVNLEQLMAALKYVDLSRLKGQRISFLCGDAGPLALATVISYKLGVRRPDNLPDYKVLAQRLQSLLSLLEDSPDELLYGKSGYLYALLFVNKHIHRNVTIPPNVIEKVINSILSSGKQFSVKMKSESPLLWQWHDKIYFGAAHGMAGILYILLQARNFIGANEMRYYIKPSIDWLMNQRFPNGNFPSSLGSSNGDRLVQWCHGSPGFVALCVLACQVFREEKYLKIAKQCGEVVWQRGLCSKGYSLCHGVSGNAYVFLQLYQLTRKPVHLYRACCFTEWCLMEQPSTELHHPDRPASLFEGLTGRIYLADDIINPLDAKFPAFCL